MRGFGKPRYWLEIVGTDGNSTWHPVNTSREKARNRAALATQDPATDYVLILDGSVPRNGVPERGQILDEFQAYDVPGGRLYRLTADSKGKVKL